MKNKAHKIRVIFITVQDKGKKLVLIIMPKGYIHLILKFNFNELVLLMHQSEEEQALMVGHVMAKSGIIKLTMFNNQLIPLMKYFYLVDNQHSTRPLN